MLSLIEELGCTSFPQNEEGTKVFEVDGVINKYSGAMPVFDIMSWIDINIVAWKIDRMCRKVVIGNAHLSDDAREWDSVSVDHWLVRHCWTKTALAVFRCYFNLLFAAEAHDLSLLFALHYIKAAGGFDPISTMRGGGQDARVKGGSYHLSQIMAEQVQGLGSTLLLDHPVASVSQHREGDEGVTVQTRNGKIFNARYVINTIPPLQLLDIRFSPSLPPARSRLHSEFPMGRVVKCYVYYERAFWTEAGYAGEIFTNRDSVSLFLDATLAEGKSPALVGFFTGEGAKKWAMRTQEERLSEVIDIVYRATGMEEARHPVHYMDKIWMQEPFSCGCYTGVLGPGALTRAQLTFTHPFGRVFWAGTEMAQSWPGYHFIIEFIYFCFSFIIQ
eukprot:TRINITY_DN4680_c1_g1_i1.p1 TRINITY_DN4680_c1_g1~~TRINITY_DN4680_c1_g1_i1.p1  ORF type:complete len:388 (-),score=71.27 TRINITY_DN4680_c1_g1_i1:414-1577(-)